MTISLPLRFEFLHFKDKYFALGLITIVWIFVVRLISSTVTALEIHCHGNYHDGDRAEGDAVRKGFANARGDILMILDADLTMPSPMQAKPMEKLRSRASATVGYCYVWPFLLFF